MTNGLLDAAITLTSREEPRVVAATGVFFDAIRRNSACVSIESVLESHRGGTWGEDAVERSGYPVLRSTNMRGKRADVADAAWRSVSEREAASYSLETGDILVTKSSGSSDLVGKSTLFSHPGDGQIYLFSNFLLRLRPCQDAIVPEYLAWFLRSPQALEWRFAAQQNAVGLRNLKTNAFLSQQVPLPDRPLQSAIVRYLDAVESSDVVAATMQLPSWLAGQRRIVAKIDALADKTSEAHHLKHWTLTECDQFWKVLSRIARDNDCRRHNLDEVADFLDGRRVPLSKTQRSTRSGPYPYYGASGVIDHIDDYIFDEPLMLLSEDGANLINRSTPIAFVAEGKYWVNNHAHVLRPKDGVADLRFLAYALSDYNVTDLNFASAQAKLNQKNARQIAIGVPPLGEQRRIVAYLDSLQAKVDAVKKLQEQSAAELDALLPSILDRAFKGEL